MVYLALTVAGARELADLAQREKMPVWLNSGTLNERQIQKLREAGLNVTTFTKRVDPADLEAIADAVSTIAEHHPGHTIWVEHVNAA
jgi:hypothetical protein